MDSRFQLARQEPDDPEDEDVEHEPHDELVGRQAVAHVGLHPRHDQPGDAGHRERGPGRARHVDARRGGERAGEHHPLERDVDRAGLLGDELAEGGEQQHRRGDHRVAVGTLVGGDVTERVEEVAHRSGPRGRGGQGAAALTDEQQGGRQQQGEDEQALHDVGDAT